MHLCSQPPHWPLGPTSPVTPKPEIVNYMDNSDHCMVMIHSDVLLLSGDLFEYKSFMWFSSK